MSVSGETAEVAKLRDQLSALERRATMAEAAAAKAEAELEAMKVQQDKERIEFKKLLDHAFDEVREARAREDKLKTQLRTAEAERDAAEYAEDERLAALLAATEMDAREADWTRPEFSLAMRIEKLTSGLSTRCSDIRITQRRAEGWIYKVGQVRKTWKRRYLVFDLDSRTVKYFEELHRPEKGVIPFDQITRVYVPKGAKDKAIPNEFKHIFVIDTLPRTYFCAAPDADTMNVWTEVLASVSQAYTNERRATMADPMRHLSVADMRNISAYAAGAHAPAQDE
eukprot:m.159605 g.159605  ORF g.159605 m.159605 type:complete len:283 (+) comp17043_c1_seq1:2492-3340(+)